MTYTAFEIHKDLTEREGFDPQTDEYYAEVDKRIRLEFPHKFDNNESQTSTAPVQNVASVNRSNTRSKQQNCETHFITSRNREKIRSATRRVRKTN